MPRRPADEASSFLVAGLLFGCSDRRPGRPRDLLTAGLAFAAMVEAIQLFIASRRFDVTDIVVGGLAAFAGRTAGPALIVNVPGWLRPACLGCWLGLVAVISWLPFNFDPDIETWRDRASHMHFIPFVDYFRISVLNAADQIFSKAALFMPLGRVLGASGPRTLLVAALVAAPIEAGQLAFSGRIPSLTDLIVEVGGAWFGHLASLAGTSSAGLREIDSVSAEIL